MELKTIDFYNENGNVSVKMRDGIRPSIFKKALTALTDEFGDGVIKNANGGISIPIAVDRKSGDVVYANFEMTVNTKDPKIKTERKKGGKKTEKVEVVIPDLFD